MGIRKGQNFNCIKCGKEFYREQSCIKKGRVKYCSRQCHQLAQGSRGPAVEVTCQFCNKNFLKRRREMERYDVNFCSKECYYENKRQVDASNRIIVKCNFCDKDISIIKWDLNNSKTKIFYCDNTCKNNYRSLIKTFKDNNKRKNNVEKIQKPKKEKIIKDFISSIGDRKLSWYDNKKTIYKHASIRENAKAVIRNFKDINKCEMCSITKPLEIAHIKPVNSFSKESTLAEVNNKDNLMVLCRNCHWLFDSDDLSLGEIKNSPEYFI